VRRPVERDRPGVRAVRDRRDLLLLGPSVGIPTPRTKCLNREKLRVELEQARVTESSAKEQGFRVVGYSANASNANRTAFPNESKIRFRQRKYCHQTVLAVLVPRPAGPRHRYPGVRPTHCMSGSSPVIERAWLEIGNKRVVPSGCVDRPRSANDRVDRTATWLAFSASGLSFPVGLDPVIGHVSNRSVRVRIPKTENIFSRFFANLKYYRTRENAMSRYNRKAATDPCV